MQAYYKLNRPVPLVDMDHTLCIEFYSLIEPIRVVQIKAQAMQTFVIVNVYVMLYFLYTTVLDVSKPLELIIPYVVNSALKTPIQCRDHMTYCNWPLVKHGSFLARQCLNTTSNGTIRYWRFISPRKSTATTLGSPCYRRTSWKKPISSSRT